VIRIGLIGLHDRDYGVTGNKAGDIIDMAISIIPFNAIAKPEI